MRLSKQEGLISPVKSLSPRLETKVSTLKQQKLPNINSTKRLSQKFFINTQDSPREKIGHSAAIRASIMEIPSPNEVKPRLSVKFSVDEPNILRKSPTYSVLEESNSVEETDTILGYWKTEVANLKVQLAKSVRDRQTNTLNYHKSVLASLEKSLHLDLSQDPFFHSVSTEDPSLIEKENEQIHVISETIQKLQTELTRAQEIIKAKEKQEKLMQHSFKEEIHTLATENSNLKSYAQELSKKIEKVKTSKTKFKSQFEGAKNEVKDSIFRCEETIEELKSDLKSKSEEVEQLQEIITRNENQKRRNAESVKDIELELTNLRREYKRLDMSYESLKQKHQSLSELFNETEKTLNIYKENNEKLEEKASKLESFELKTFEMSTELKLNSDKINSLKYIIEVQRQQFTKKEQTYHSTIQDLLERLEQAQLLSNVSQAETSKLKKALTIKDFDDNLSTFTREEVQRYMARLHLSEEIAAGQQVEIEKLKKTQDYYKDLLSSKNEIIDKLQKENQARAEPVAKDKDLLELLRELRSKVHCYNCNSQHSVSFLAPCHHVFCEACLPSVKRCPFCQAISTFVSPSSYLRTVHSLLQQLEELIY